MTECVFLTLLENIFLCLYIFHAFSFENRNQVKVPLADYSATILPQTTHPLLGQTPAVDYSEIQQIHLNKAAADYSATRTSLPAAPYLGILQHQQTLAGAYLAIQIIPVQLEGCLGIINRRQRLARQILSELIQILEGDYLEMQNQLEDLYSETQQHQQQVIFRDGKFLVFRIVWYFFLKIPN
jgi:hypothetical protein